MFLMDLHAEDTSFFEAEPEQITDSEMLRNLIIFLEFPMHKNMTSFYFYDVLTICCRYTCEMDHHTIKKERQSFKINYMVERIMAFKSTTKVNMLNDANNRMREDEKCGEIFE